MPRARFLVPFLLALGCGGAAAQTRTDTLRYVTPGTINTFDPVMLGATPESTALSTSLYDRLLRFERVPRGDGSFVFDFAHLRGELAEGASTSPDGRILTVRLRPDAVWPDGAPVTSEDVKWSLDRAVTAATMARAQLATGSLLRADQIAVVDPRTVTITLDRPDRLALPNLATPYAPIFNAALARRHATPDDPWASAWLKDNVAGGGAYLLASAEPGRSVVLVRNPLWRSGKPPAFGRVVVQTVPEPATRAALMARGDADLAIGLQGADLSAVAASGAARVVSTPMPSGFIALVFNTRLPPFDRPEVRWALALAVPYGPILSAALDGRGEVLSGATWSGEPPTGAFPQPLPVRQDLAAAKRALAEAGFPDGFETTLSFAASRAFFAEPAAALVQEAFARIGVRVSVEKLTDSVMAAAVTEKRLPMLIERSFALFPSTPYFFGIFMSGPSRWNFAGWDDPEVERLISEARTARDPARSEAIDRALVARAAEALPIVFIARPTFDVVLARGLSGFTTWENYYPDLRDPVRD